MKQNESGFKNRKAAISIVMVLAMVISGLAVLATPVSVAEGHVGGAYGGVLRVAIESQPSSLNPLSDSLNESAEQVIDILYESLGRIDPYTMELKSWMAQSWTIDPADESIVSVELKNGMVWHDGTGVTLDDIIYTFGPDGYDIGYVSSMTKDEANNSIIFDLDAPDSRFFGEMMQMKVVPSGFTATSAPNGCGPFKLDSFDDESITVVAFDDHFIARPYIDSMIYTYYPYSTEFSEADYPWTQTAADPRSDGFYRAAYDLMTDKIDFIGWDLFTDDIYMLVEIGGNTSGNNLIEHPDTITRQSNGLKQWHLSFNNAEGHILNDPVLRRAISYAIDKDVLTAYDIGGGLEKADSVISKFNLPWFNTSITYPDYNLATARQILDDAGYMNYNGTGYICKPGPDPEAPWEGATEISLRLYGPLIEDVTPYTMSTNLITWFELLGIHVELISNATEVHTPKILEGDFDMFLADQEGELDPQFIYDLYHSENIGSTNILNFKGKLSVDNYTLMDYLIEEYEGEDNETRIIQLEDTNLYGAVMVYHNDTLVADTHYNIDLENGILTLDNNTQYPIDYLNDTFDITYNYLPFDSAVEKASAQMDLEMRAKYIKEAQGVLVELMPSIPLFSYKVSHAYKTGIYVDWVQTLGGINNYWSFTNIKNKVVGDSTVSLSGVKNFLNDGESMNLFVRVQDMEGAPIEAELALTGEGTFGTPTHDGQQYTVPYTAPSTTSSRTVTLSVEVFSVGYTSSSDTLDITIHPLMNNFVIDISRGATSLPSGNTTSITAIVKDRATSATISGASVVLTMTPAGLGGYLESVSGTTDASGEFITTFGSDNVTIDTTFRITAYVTKAGYADAEQTTSISVDRDPNIEVSGTDKGLLGLPGPSFMALIIMLSGMSVIYAVYRRKRY